MTTNKYVGKLIDTRSIAGAMDILREARDNGTMEEYRETEQYLFKHVSQLTDETEYELRVFKEFINAYKDTKKKTKVVYSN